MPSSLWLSFDELLFKQLSKRSNADSLIYRIVDDLSLNDSLEWRTHSGLPFAFNFEANLDGEKHVIIPYFNFIFLVVPSKVDNFLNLISVFFLSCF